VRKLLAFAEVETDGGRDILRAAEVTPDPLLRRLYLAHAIDELRHGNLFRQRGSALLRERRSQKHRPSAATLAADGHGLSGVRIDDEPDETLLAFLHLSERAAAQRFSIYREVVDDDTPTRRVFEEILRDEVFHMNYTQAQLARVAGGSHRKRLWRARVSRLWKQYLRLALAVANGISTALLTLQYFTVIPLFAWLAKRSSRRERPGWTPLTPERKDSLTRQY
jgi:rubrerythrin